MANVLYDSGRNAFLATNATGGVISWTGSGTAPTGVPTFALIHTVGGTQPYVFSAAHVFWSSVIAFSGALIGTPVAVSSPTAVAGVAGCNNVVFPAVPVSPSVDAIIVYKNTGTASTSLLICYIDTASGLPTTPNTSDITLIIDTGANKLFKL